MALCFAQVIAAPAPAAPFVNLDFEQAQVQPINPNFIVAATGMPGWTPRIGGVHIANLDYNSIGIGLPAVSLFDREDTQLGLPIPQGLYYAAVNSGSSVLAESLIDQIGDVPSDSRSIEIIAYARPLVFLDETPIELVRIEYPLPGLGFGWARFAGDITQMAGQSSVKLTITSGPAGGGAFDDIRLTSRVIPEPGMTQVLVVLHIGATVGLRSIRRDGGSDGHRIHHRSS